jgi:hypothetical protein
VRTTVAPTLRLPSYGFTNSGKTGSAGSTEAGLAVRGEELSGAPLVSAALDEARVGDRDRHPLGGETVAVVGEDLELGVDRRDDEGHARGPADGEESIDVRGVGGRGHRVATVRDRRRRAELGRHVGREDEPAGMDAPQLVAERPKKRDATAGRRDEDVAETRHEDSPGQIASGRRHI